MEATAAIGLAGNIVQFFDFSMKLSKTIFEIWNSDAGSSKSNASMELTVRTFQESLDSISNDLCKYRKFLGQENTQDDHMQRIIDGCKELADDLTARLLKLRVTESSSNWKKFVRAVYCAWKENELLDMEEKLSRFRIQVETRVLFSLRLSMNALETQQKTLSDKLLELRREAQFDKLQPFITAAIAETIDRHFRALPQWSISERQGNRSGEPTQSPMTEVEDGIHGSAPQHDPVRARETIAQRFAIKLAKTEESVLDSLNFAVLHDREEAITPAEEATLAWIFGPPRSSDRPWDNFSQWLQDPAASFYWINGKAGSGKSTLIKYLISHPKTITGLKRWAGNTKLLIASFFFWYSGYELQKSQVGLLRGLLYMCLREHRELIPLVLPEAAGVDEVELGTFWTMPRLRRAFQRLLSQKRFALKFCFFIDGLDEYSGAHSEIAAFVKEVAAYDNVKLCASSRPLAVFDPAFHALPCLVLQHLTFDDINMYITRKLTGNELMSDLEKDEPGLRQELTATIITKASGVFLWVRLVVDSLLDGLSNHDVGLDLKRRIDDLPPDIEDLHWHMIDRVTPKWYLEEGFRLLRLVQTSGGQIPLIELCLAESTVDIHNKRLLDGPTSAELKAHCLRMAGRLKSRCLGLLEVMWETEQPQTTSPKRKTVRWEDEQPQTTSPERQTVTFIHKSVLDFLETDNAKVRIMKIPGQEKFRPEVALMRGTLLAIKLYKARLPPNQEEFKRRYFFDYIRPLVCDFLKWAKIAENEYKRAEVALVRELRDTVDIFWGEVAVKSEIERSEEIHWFGAARSLRASNLHKIEVFPTWADIKLAEPLGTIPIMARSFADVVRWADLRYYMAAEDISIPSWPSAPSSDYARTAPLIDLGSREMSGRTPESETPERKDEENDKEVRARIPNETWKAKWKKRLSLRGILDKVRRELG